MENPYIDKNGTKFWYNSDGKIHREDGPAIEWISGEKSWWNNGKLHRDDGPAVEYVPGTKKWFKNGKRHRDDGPAIEHGDGTKEWHINDIDITDKVNQWIKDNNFQEYEEWTDSIKLMFKLTFDEI